MTYNQPESMIFHSIDAKNEPAQFFVLKVLPISQQAINR